MEIPPYIPEGEAALMSHQRGAVHCPSVLKMPPSRARSICTESAFLYWWSFTVADIYKRAFSLFFNELLHPNCV